MERNLPDVILVPVEVPGSETSPALPTYATVADVLEKKNGSGWRLAGWTVLRTLLIAPPMMAVGVPAKQAFGGAALASGLISVFTLMRIAHAGANAGVGRGGLSADAREAMMIGHAVRTPSRGRGHYR
jgi:hypothetical protein